MSRSEQRYEQRHQIPEISFSPEQLIAEVGKIGDKLTDTRKGNNTQYSQRDFLLSGLSVFFMQSPSFLEYQQSMETKYGMNNARNLFGIKKIPSPEQMRNKLDEIDAQTVFPVFQYCFDKLIETKGIEQFKSNIGYLMLLDGTGYFSSNTIHCKNCLTKTDKKGKVTYYHSGITPVLAKPGSEYVLPLPPEYIVPQDGSEKQDCENTAAKRFISGTGKKYATKLEEVTILGDDLYCHQPFIEKAIQEGYHVILVCKKESHIFLYDWISKIPEGEEAHEIRVVQQRRFNGRYHEITTMRYINQVPLKDGKDAILVNWLEMTVINEKTGKQIYHNAWATDNLITSENIYDLCLAGRTRWKIENENNNTLKTKGYHFEHNYGHGSNHLSTLLATLIIIAFLFHTLLDLTHEGYRKIRGIISSRQKFFNDLKTLTIYSCYRNWDHLFAWMVFALTKGQHQSNFSLPPPLMFTSK
jgi:hypothetical protein